MDCPKCFQRMETVTYRDIEVERCTGCRGLWFGLLEAEKLASIPGSEAIDDGDPHEGARWDAVKRVQCPECSTRMIRMADARQHHLWYEACKICGGMFFDAGEFRDYKEHSILDFFHDLFTRERG